MLNVCGDVYVLEQNKFKISWSCHLDYKQTLSRDSINRVWLAIGYFALYFILYALSKFGMLKLTFDSAML